MRAASNSRKADFIPPDDIPFFMIPHSLRRFNLETPSKRTFSGGIFVKTTGLSPESAPKILTFTFPAPYGMIPDGKL